MSIETLIEAILAGPDDEAAPHQAELAALGAAAIPSIVEGVNANKGPPRRRLAEVLGGIRDTEAIPLLLAALEQRNRQLLPGVLTALAHLPDPRNVAPLLEMWARNESGLVAEALAATGDPAVAAAFRSTLERWLGGTNDPSRALENMSSGLVSTLATMTPVLTSAGDNLAFEVLHAVARDATGDEVRERALLAMWRAVGPGCVETLRAALKDRVAINRQHAVFASYFLGVGTLVGDLVTIGMTDTDVTVAATARDAVGRIAGLEPTREAPAPDAIGAWFDDKGTQLDANVAYRGGMPIHPRTVAALIAIEPLRAWDRALEFELLTGAGLPHHSANPMPREQIGALAVDWADKHAGDFDPGAIYRGGKRIELPKVS